MARVADQQTAAVGAGNTGIGLAGRHMRERHRETWLQQNSVTKLTRKLAGSWAVAEPKLSPEVLRGKSSPPLLSVTGRGQTWTDLLHVAWLAAQHSFHLASLDESDADARACLLGRDPWHT